MTFNAVNWLLLKLKLVARQTHTRNSNRLSVGVHRLQNVTDRSLVCGTQDYVLADYLFRRDGVASISGLNAAVQAISTQLDWVPKPKELSEQEKAIEAARKGDAKMRSDYFRSLEETHTQKITVSKANDAQKAATAKEISSIKGQIDSVINNYVCGHHSGATNWARTEAGQETMRKVLAKHTLSTMEDAKAALEAVRAAKAKLP